MCVNWFCDPVKDFCRVSDGEHAVELACSFLIPPRLFLALGTRNILLGKGNNNKRSGGLVFQAWLALPCSPFAEGLWTYSLFLLFFTELNMFHLLEPPTAIYHEEAGALQQPCCVPPSTRTFPFGLQGCRASFNLIGFVYAFIWASVLNAHSWESGQALDLFCRDGLEELSYGRDCSIVLWCKAIS